MKSCTHPQNGMTIRSSDGEIEIGMGQHGEGGGGRKQLVSANETAEENDRFVDEEATAESR